MSVRLRMVNALPLTEKKKYQVKKTTLYVEIFFMFVCLFGT